MKTDEIQRKSFMFYISWKEQIELLNDDELRRFINNLINYHTDDEIQLDTTADKLVWNGVKIALEENHKKYLEKVKNNQENGKLGGRPKKEALNPKGFENNQMVIKENPENLIKEKRKEEKEKRKKINENGEKKIENRKLKVGNDSKDTISKENKLEDGFIDSEKKIESTLSNLNVDIENIQNKFENIFQFDKKLYSKINTSNSGIDIVKYSVIEDFIGRIINIWNSPNSNKYENLSNIFEEISSLVVLQFDDVESFSKHYEGNFRQIPQNLVTENNSILFQLFLNLDDFLISCNKEIKEISKISTGNVENKKIEKKMHSSTTQIIDNKTDKPISSYFSEGVIPKEKYEYFNLLIQKNQELDKKERNEDLLIILKKLQQYFINVFGSEIWKLIKEDETIRIKLNDHSGYNWKTIYLYQNLRDLYRRLIDTEIQ